MIIKKNNRKGKYNDFNSEEIKDLLALLDKEDPSSDENSLSGKYSIYDDGPKIMYEEDVIKMLKPVKEDMKTHETEIENLKKDCTNLHHKVLALLIALLICVTLIVGLIFTLWEYDTALDSALDTIKEVMSSQTVSSTTEGNFKYE